MGLKLVNGQWVNDGLDNTRYTRTPTNPTGFHATNTSAPPPTTTPTTVGAGTADNATFAQLMAAQAARTAAAPGDWYAKSGSTYSQGSAGSTPPDRNSFIQAIFKGYASPEYQNFLKQFGNTGMDQWIQYYGPGGQGFDPNSWNSHGGLQEGHPGATPTTTPPNTNPTPTSGLPAATPVNTGFQPTGPGVDPSNRVIGGTPINQPYNNYSSGLANQTPTNAAGMPSNNYNPVNAGNGATTGNYTNQTGLGGQKGVQGTAAPGQGSSGTVSNSTYNINPALYVPSPH